MSSEFIIREANVSDADSLALLNYELIQFEFSQVLISVYQVKSKEITLNLLKSYWNAMLSSSSSFKGFKAFVSLTQEGQIVGYIKTEIRFLPPYFSPLQEGFISGLYVKPEFQKRGLGQRLLETAHNFFKENGINLVELGVLLGNHLAEKFWEKAGYKFFRKEYFYFIE